MGENPKDKNDEKYGSLRNILKNFDPYAVLEPLTPQGIPKENILVDLTDESSPTCDINHELSGSLLEKSTKSEFEVIDVFQNLFVTPQHVVESKNKNGIDKSTDKDWIKIFDGIDHANNDETDIKKELESIFTVNTKINATLTRLPDDDFDVDEIDEVLMMKRIEKVMRSSQNNVDSCTNYVESCSNVNTVKIEEPSLFKTNNTEANKDIKIDKRENIGTNFLCYNCMVNKNEKTAIKNKNFQIIKTIKLDKKKLQKKLVLPDDIKRNYTKGPDLVEKSIALPSMIQRIKVRQQLIINEKCLKRRLLLEPDLTFAGTDTEITNDRMSTFSPQILTEDCNKQRLLAFQAGKAFEKFVTGEK